MENICSTDSLFRANIKTDFIFNRRYKTFNIIPGSLSCEDYVSLNHQFKGKTFVYSFIMSSFSSNGFLMVYLV